MSELEYTEGAIRNYMLWIDNDVRELANQARKTEIDMKSILRHAPFQYNYTEAAEKMSQITELINEVRELID